MEKPFIKLANASGFLFQIGIDHEITRVRASKGGNWEVIAREHRWFDPASNSEAFIDLILQSHAGRMIVECKRTTDATWLFLVPNSATEVKRAKLLWTCQAEGNPPVTAWDDLNLHPPSLESSFCIVRGRGEGDAPMLERLAGSLLRATEAVAEQELSIGPQQAYGPARIYLPVVITNADLRVCRFSPEDIDLKTGRINKTETQAVDFLKFRKSLSTTHQISTGINDLQQANIEDERTVIVMNVTALESILPHMKLQKPSIVSPSGPVWPWEIAIRRFGESP
ncbi:MAG: hypothetical protein WCD80_06150 [Desulfobaccales bacterium]